MALASSALEAGWLVRSATTAGGASSTKVVIESRKLGANAEGCWVGVARGFWVTAIGGCEVTTPETAGAGRAGASASGAVGWLAGAAGASAVPDVGALAVAAVDGAAIAAGVGALIVAAADGAAGIRGALVSSGDVEAAAPDAGAITPNA